MRFVTLVSALLISAQAFSMGLDMDAIQMQRLIESSQQQLKVATELLKQAQQDGASAERAAKVLDQLSKGLDQKIQGLQGTKTYDNALLRLQQDGAMRAGAEAIAGETDEQARARQNFHQFQQQTHGANTEDMAVQARMADALNTAQPGFVPKIQAQAALGQWQANTRVSAQLTQLLAAIQGLRQDLNNGGSNKPTGLGVFLDGSAEMSKSQTKGSYVP